jgi:hypothetical protein
MPQQIPNYFPDINNSYLNNSLHDKLLRIAEVTEDPELREAILETTKGKRDFRELMQHSQFSSWMQQGMKRIQTEYTTLTSEERDSLASQAEQEARTKGLLDGISDDAPISLSFLDTRE